jgi:peptidoglycan/xylan/chitin deacetylase (PgdA/CDA1 family)
MVVFMVYERKWIITSPSNYRARSRYAWAMKLWLPHGLGVSLLALAFNTLAEATPVEIRGRIVREGDSNRVALTLDACSGQYDEKLIGFLVQNRIPATLFVTKRWLDRNPDALENLKTHLDLFALEDHGERHVPAVIGAGRTVYGIAVQPDLAHLQKEVRNGAKAVERATGIAPHWYRAATGIYDEEAIQEIRKLGFKIAGFSVNADSGATLSKASILKRLRKVKGGDVIIAHMNKPDSDTAQGLSEGLPEILGRGLVFVRLDQVELKESRIPVPDLP